MGFSNAEQYSLSEIKRASTKTENKIVTSSVAKKNYYCYVRNYILPKKRLKNAPNIRPLPKFTKCQILDILQKGSYAQMAYFGVEISKIGNLRIAIRSWL